uniref:Uncharacterized protein n=1 Tax=Chlamydomonas euryale TaxID=1486919 RepID=A0A7R9VMW6_9CHLO|mmetsp:Transcript_39343/g.117049  ORF Transcript_39343/g.117049 Transcript_39343/m.117049 type:complete len:129 (+) Transcript_39343:95-481(+)
MACRHAGNVSRSPTADVMCYYLTASERLPGGCGDPQSPRRRLTQWACMCAGGVPGLDDTLNDVHWMMCNVVCCFWQLPGNSVARGHTKTCLRASAIAAVTMSGLGSHRQRGKEFAVAPLRAHAAIRTS